MSKDQWFFYACNMRGNWSFRRWFNIDPNEYITKEDKERYSTFNKLKPEELSLSDSELQKLYPPPPPRTLKNETSAATVVQDLGDKDGKTS